MNLIIDFKREVSVQLVFVKLLIDKPVLLNILLNKSSLGVCRDWQL